MKKSQLLITLSSAFIVTACMPIYQEPKTLDTSTATITFNDAIHLGVSNVAAIYSDPATCKNPHAFKRKRSFTDDNVVSVPANQLLTFMYSHSKYFGMNIVGSRMYEYNSCAYIVSLIPEKNKTYKVRIEDGPEINGKRSCDFSLEGFNSANQKVPVKYVIREQVNSTKAAAILPGQCRKTSGFLANVK